MSCIHIVTVFVICLFRLFAFRKAQLKSNFRSKLHVIISLEHYVHWAISLMLPVEVNVILILPLQGHAQSFLCTETTPPLAISCHRMSRSPDLKEDPMECPLCMEPLEIDDVNFFPCTCGYQICRFCWHRIRTDENGLCPACRKVLLHVKLQVWGPSSRGVNIRMLVCITEKICWKISLLLGRNG